ncbi:MAG: DoxX family protein, partial [Gammaproteobacteria bacterium]|nr:DoxX family protein [Gammaproteobacteria bacterium]
IIVGWKTRLFAFLLAGFTLIAGIIFHNQFSDPNELNHFMKNLSIVGGFLYLVKFGAGELSLDNRKSRNR